MTPSLTSKADWRPQFAAGLLNSWCFAGFAWAALGDWLGPWGWAACLLVPFGIIEMAVALYARSSDEPRGILRWLALFEVMALCLGSLPSAIVGFYVLAFVRGVSPRAGTPR